MQPTTLQRYQTRAQNFYRNHCGEDDPTYAFIPRRTGLTLRPEGALAIPVRPCRGRLREGAESYAKALASDILR